MEQRDRAAFGESVKDAPRGTFVVYYLLELSPIHLLPDPIRVGHCRKQFIGPFVAAALQSLVGADGARNGYPVPTPALQVMYEESDCNEQGENCELTNDVAVLEEHNGGDYTAAKWLPLGKNTQKTDPLPSTLRMRIRPPCFTTISSLTQRPSPVPTASFVVTKGLKR